MSALTAETIWVDYNTADARLSYRAIMMKDKCLIFDPDTVNAKKFMEVLAPRLQAPQSDGRLRNKQHQNGDQPDWQSEGATKPPFELECLEGAFTVAVGEHSSLDSIHLARQFDSYNKRYGILSYALTQFVHTHRQIV